MPASALPQDDHEDFAHSLATFANALFGPSAPTGPETDSGATEGVAHAIAVARSAKVVSEARILAYRALVARFLRTSLAETGSGLSAQASAVRQRGQAQTDAGVTIAALHRLAPVEKAVLLLVVVERFSYADAALVMDLEVRALTAALARAREAFAARLACVKGGGRAHLRLVEEQNDP